MDGWTYGPKCYDGVLRTYDYRYSTYSEAKKEDKGDWIVSGKFCANVTSCTSGSSSQTASGSKKTDSKEDDESFFESTIFFVILAVGVTLAAATSLFFCVKEGLICNKGNKNTSKVGMT